MNRPDIAISPGRESVLSIGLSERLHFTKFQCWLNKRSWSIQYLTENGDNASTMVTEKDTNSTTGHERKEGSSLMEVRPIGVSFSRKVASSKTSKSMTFFLFLDQWNAAAGTGGGLSLSIRLSLGIVFKKAREQAETPVKVLH
jgi:hypothetical protein